jgi:hypothetical protein
MGEELHSKFFCSKFPFRILPFHIHSLAEKLHSYKS